MSNGGGEGSSNGGGEGSSNGGGEGSSNGGSIRSKLEPHEAVTDQSNSLTRVVLKIAQSDKDLIIVASRLSELEGVYSAWSPKL